MKMNLATLVLFITLPVFTLHCGPDESSSGINHFGKVMQGTGALYDDDISKAQDLTTGNYENIAIGHFEQQFYRLQLDPGQSMKVTLRFDHDSADIDAELYDSTSRRVVDGSYNIVGVEVVDAVTANTYYLKVYSYDGGATSYQMEVSISANDNPVDNQCYDDRFDTDGAGQYPNDVDYWAARLNPGKYNDLVLCPDDEDWYQVELRTGQKITAKLFYDSYKDPLKLTMYDERDNVLARGYDATNEPRVTYQAPSRQTVRIQVEGQQAGAQNIYSLDIFVIDAEGCEGLIKTSRDTSPTDLPDLCGDTNESGTIFRRGVGSKLYRIKLKECSSWSSDLHICARLQSPTGIDYDFILYQANDHDVKSYGQDQGEGGIDKARLMYDTGYWGAESAYYYLDLYYYWATRAEHCSGQWTLEIRGNCPNGF